MVDDSINEKVLENFINKFIKEINDYKKLFKDLGLNISDYLPDIFTHDHLGVQVLYSNKTQHILFRFDKRDKFHFFSKKIEGQVFDFFDPYNYWNKNSAAFHLKNSYGDSNQSFVDGLRPFIFEGENLECSISNFTFVAPRFGRVLIEYAFVFSFKAFINVQNNIRGFLSRFMSVIKEYKEQDTTPVLYREYLEKLKRKMEEIFFNESIPELEIDKFIEMNPVILELGLNITKPLSQAKLKNVLNKYEHDLKPDLIAYDNRARNWVIIDYKKAKRTVLKNVGAVRTGFRSEVYSLKDQLRDYVRYFQEKNQRDYFRKKYGFDIKRPRAIGIIGNVIYKERDDFEDLLLEMFDQQYNIVPYNYLYDNFCESVDFAFKFIK